jgi:sugar O-acyltransferase (sialic acid O-acetyltransferase NeuD family)
MIKVVGLGAGGHARVMLEILAGNSELEIVGLLTATAEERGTIVLGVPVLGDDQLLPGLIAKGVAAAFIGVGSTGQSARRRELYDRAIGLGLRVVAAVHPSAILSPSADLGASPTIMAGVIVNAGARLGVNVILNTGAIVEHDVRIGDHCHVAPGARIGGDVRIGNGSHIGLGAAVRQGQRIGAGVVIGAGAVVVDDVPDGAVVAGVPARPLKSAR